MPIKNLLFPTDFTSYSKNAIEYGIQYALFSKTKKIVVVHVYSANNPIVSQSVASVTVPEMLQDKQNELNNIRANIVAKLGDDVQVVTLLVEGKLIPIIHELINSEKIDMTIVGISEKTKLEQTIVGSNSIAMMRKTTCPIIIVPHKATWVEKPIVAVSIDITQNLSLLPLEKTKSLIKQIGYEKLLLLNIDDEDNHGVHIQNPNIEKINFEFKDFNSQISIVNNSDKLEAVNRFCHNKQVSLLVMYERKYGIIDTIFHKSLIRQVAYKSHTPVLVLEENSII